MKAIVIPIVLVLAAVAGILAWRATLPVETWTTAVISPSVWVNGELDPHQSAAERREKLRQAVLAAKPAPPNPPAEEFGVTSILTLRVECSIRRRDWRWGWPPLDTDFPIQRLGQASLYYRSRTPAGWQAGSDPYGKEPLSRDQAIERLLDLIESHIQEWRKTAESIR